MSTLLDILLQGALLGGLYALFAAGLSLMFGVMRLVNLAHGDLIVLAAFLILAAGQWPRPEQFSRGPRSPCRCCSWWVMRFRWACSTGCSGANILPPLLLTFGLSIIVQNGLLQGFSADSRRLPAPGIEDGLDPARRRPRGRSRAGADLRHRGPGHPRPQRVVLSHPARARLPGRLGRSRHGATDGHRQPPPVRHRHGAGAGGCGRWPASSSASRTNFDPSAGPGAADLRLRGGHHRRARFLLGHARGRGSCSASRRPRARR